MTLTGLDRLEADPGLLAESVARAGRAGPGSRDRLAGLVANPGSVTRGLARSVEIAQRACAAAGLRLAGLFGPEHGFYGEAQAGEKVANGIDRATGLPVHSLYGESRRIDQDLLSSLDLLILDLPDVGARPYTYLSTLDLLVASLGGLEASGRHAPLLVVLDRPNPLGGTAVEGMGVERGFESFVGARDIPLRHGLTIGEFALLSAAGLTDRVSVLAMEGWERESLWTAAGLPWIPPSPNLPTFDSALCYPATVIIEGTNLSEGRGTTRPFEVLGAPWIDGEELADRVNALGLGGLAARPLWFVPTFSKHQGVRCGGIQLHVTDPGAWRPLDASYAILDVLRDGWPREFAFLPPHAEGRKPFIDLITGNALARSGARRGELGDKARSDEAAFRERRRPFLLYPEARQGGSR